MPGTTPTTRTARTKRDGSFAEYVYTRDGEVIRRSPRPYLYCTPNGGSFSAKPSSSHSVRIVVVDDKPEQPNPHQAADDMLDKWADVIALDTADTKEATVPKTTSKAKPAAPKGDALMADMLAAVVEAFGKKSLIAKKTYTRVAQDKTTLAYVNPGVTQLRVDVPDGDGGYDKFTVAKAGDITKAINAMKKLVG